MKKKQATTIHIEKVALTPKRRGNGDFDVFVMAVKRLKVGESFVYRLGNDHRAAIKTFRIAFEYSIIVHGTGDKGMYRIGRTG